MPTVVANWRDVPCDIWTGTLDKDGYGYICSGKKSHGTKAAHRIAWIEANGPIPDGMLVLHRCDNRPCRERSHLFIGTNADNMRDRDAKGRQASGVRVGNRYQRGTI